MQVYVCICACMWGTHTHTHTFSPYFWDRASHCSWSSLIARLTGQQALRSLSFWLFLPFPSALDWCRHCFLKYLLLLLIKSIHLFDIPTAVSPPSSPPIPSPYLTPHNTIPHPTACYPNPLLLCFCSERARSPSTFGTPSGRSRACP